MKLNTYVSDPEGARGGLHRADAATLLQHASVDIAFMRQFVKDSPALLTALDKILGAGPPRGRLG